MDPVKDFPSMIFNLTQAFNYRYPGGIGGPARMIGIVFASPQSPLAKSDILPRIADWHCRSENNTDFFFAGYEQHQEESEGYMPVTIPGLENWQYSPLKFNEFRKSLEQYTAWQYAGGCELILLDAIYDHQNSWAAIDFSAAVVCDLNTMKDEKAIESVEKFFESIFRYGDENGHAHGFVDAEARKFGNSSIMKMVLSLLPLKAGEEIAKVSHFAVRDISRPASGGGA
jgi:hypothetical protein